MSLNFSLLTNCHCSLEGDGYYLVFQFLFLPSGTLLNCHWPLPGAITIFPFLSYLFPLLCFLSYQVIMGLFVSWHLSKMKAYDKKHIQQETGIVRKDFISILKGKMIFVILIYFRWAISLLSKKTTNEEIHILVDMRTGSFQYPWILKRCRVNRLKMKCKPLTIKLNIYQ